MKILDVEQKSVDWMLARAGIPTASEFDQLVTPKFKIRDGQMPQTYLYKKLAERWLGGPLADFNTYDVEQGIIQEEQARPFWELEHGISIQRVGLVTTDDGRIGCSPDGLIGDDGGIEIKCPTVHHHIAYLMKGVVPDDYLAQIHGSLYVSGRKWWRFLSYCRRLPALDIEVHRDEQICRVIEEALSDFLAKLEYGWQKLCELNGGPPVRQAYQRPQPMPITEPELTDIIP